MAANLIEHMFQKRHTRFEFAIAATVQVDTDLDLGFAGIALNFRLALAHSSSPMHMYVVFEAPLQMLCESPSRYRQEQETVDFISSTPTTWDETHVLEAAVSDYLVIARRKNNNWYVAAMTDDTPREFSIALDFLDSGTYEMEIFKDGMNADNYAEDYKRELIEVKKGDSVSMKLVGGGGWVAQIRSLTD